MINEKCAKSYCKDDIAKIENYDKAINDTTQTWELHHTLELTLDGEFAHTQEELKRLGMYYHRPYFELIFLTKSEHSRLHSRLNKKGNQNMKGHRHSDETRQKMSEAKKGMTFTDEHRRNLSEAMKGRKRRPFTAEHRRKMSEAAKARCARNAATHKAFGLGS